MRKIPREYAKNASNGGMGDTVHRVRGGGGGGDG